jgi:hypothetical protein
MKIELMNRRRLFNAIRVGDIERVRAILAGNPALGEAASEAAPVERDARKAAVLRAAAKPVDPNVCDRRGRPALIAAVRALILESGVVDALLEAGADPKATDAQRMTALDHARRRFERLGPGPDRVRRSPSLDASGNLRLRPEEQEFMEQMRREHPDMADEFIEMYFQERRKAALRQFMPRRELRIIVSRLEAPA